MQKAGSMTRLAPLLHFPQLVKQTAGSLIQLQSVLATKKSSVLNPLMLC